MNNTNEQLPVQVISRLLGSQNMRVVITEHPVTKELAPCVPYLDYAKVFSYNEKAILKMISRTPWLKRYSSTSIMEVEGVGFRPHVCIFEEAMLAILLKMQPKRCKDPKIAAQIDKKQEELILILRDTLRGYRTNHGGYVSSDGKLPWPGLSMDAIATLCKQADKGGRTSLRALGYFTGLPVEDLLEELQTCVMPDNAIMRFVDTCLTINPDAREKKRDVYDRYLAFCQAQGCEAFNYTHFGRALHGYIPGLRTGRESTGERVNIYKGIRLRLVH